MPVKEGVPDGVRVLDGLAVGEGVRVTEVVCEGVGVLVRVAVSDELDDRLPELLFESDPEEL